MNNPFQHLREVWQDLRGFSTITVPTASTAQTGVRVDLDELIQLRLQVKRLELSDRRRVMSFLAGGHLSGLRGRGVDFLETRHYQPGDDIRAIDWRVTARSNRPHTKVFREERERPVLFLVDYGPRMWFGTRVAFKAVVAARAAALLAWAVAGHGDRVGGFVFSPTWHQDLRPAGGRRGVLRLLRTLSIGNTPAAGLTEGSHLGQALAQARRVTHPGSLICILSDFSGLDAEAETHLHRLAQHADVLGLFIYDALEQQLPPPGVYPVSDGTATFSLDSHSPALRHRYQQQFAQRYAELHKRFLQRGLRLLPLATHQPVVSALQQLANKAQSGSDLGTG